jgi:tetratricopeptide (TPR) repeat protein
MLIRLFVLLPAGGIMFRATLLPACAGALACVLLYRAARDCGVRRSAAVLAAGVLAVMPYLWWQSTMLEKYALQLFFSALVIRMASHPATGFLAAGYVFALAVASHPLALMLAPLPALAFSRVRGRGKKARAAVLFLVLGLLPSSARVVYTAERSHALDYAAKRGGEAINWGEPFTARALLDYGRLKYYGGRFSSAPLARATLAQHLRNFPDQLTWPVLALGLAGVAIMLVRDLPAGIALTAVAVLSFGFSLRIILPPVMSAQYHQIEFLLAVLFAAVAIEALASQIDRWRPAWPFFLAVAIGALSLLAWFRYPAFDAGRHFFVHDYLMSAMRLAPPGAVMMGAVEGDSLAPRYFAEVMGIRSDVACLPMPVRTMSSQFIIRPRYRSWAESVLPHATLHFTDSDPDYLILRRLVGDNAGRYCFAVTGFSEGFVPRDLFDLRGNLFLGRGGLCGGNSAGDGLAGWRGMSSRSWFSPAVGMGPHRAVIESVARSISETAARLPPTEKTASLLRVRTRLLPGQPTGWVNLAENYGARGRVEEGLAFYRRAAVLAPGSPQVLFGLLRMELRAGRTRDAAERLRAILSRPPFSLTAEGRDALEKLNRGEVRAAFDLAILSFARVALEEADRLPLNPETARKRTGLYALAADLAPRWALAQERRAAVLLSMGQLDEARSYLGRLRELEPGNVALHLKWAEMLSAAGRREEARRVLADVARRRPDGIK